MDVLIAAQWFGELVSGHVGSVDVDEFDGALSYLLTYEVVSDVDMFGALVMLRILRQRHCSLTVGEYGGWSLSLGFETELVEQRTQPHGLLSRLTFGHVLGLHGGKCNALLSL